MRRDPHADPQLAPAPAEAPESVPPRIFLREPGWQIALKVGSERTFCYQVAPGEDYYHRLADGELFVFRGDERLCLPCAGRRGLLSHEPRGLREPLVAIEDFVDEDGDAGYELKDANSRLSDD